MEEKMKALEEKAPEVYDIINTFIMSDHTKKDYEEMFDYLSEIQYEDE